MRSLSRDLARWVMRTVAARFDRALWRREPGMVVVVSDGSTSEDASIGREVSWAGARFDLASGGRYCATLQVRESRIMGVVWSESVPRDGRIGREVSWMSARLAVASGGSDVALRSRALRLARAASGQNMRHCKPPVKPARVTNRRIGRRIRSLLSILMLTASPAFAESPEFAAVTPDHAISLPQDTGAHAGFRTEWWYATGWLTTPDNQPLGFQITFFRSATGHDAADPSAFAPSQLIIAHAALSDPSLGHLAHDQRIARQGFGLAYAKPANTDVKLDAWKMIRAADGHYDVVADANGFSLHLKLTPTQAPLIQGERGYSRKGPRPEQASYYYSEPQLRVTGGVVRPVAAGGPSRGETTVTGMAWLDHEWSSTLLDANAAGWDWLGANLADGSALMAFKVRSRDGHAVWAHAAFRKPDGEVTTFGPNQVDFTPLRTWRSPRTNTSYPVSMAVKTGLLTWKLDPLMDDQELDSRQSTGAVYWEGAVRVSREGVDAGRAYLELTGYANALRLGGE
ncbi:secreted hydrolase-like protein [Paraburkholderia phytofirmans PsJN]|uniref:Secreted hydrolase-like protein n=2 Tax=Paraburkholderia phytofirmans TaxID=261302 RepID=B2TCE5_PARPJ|nr:secreted hydrolase-like protein [Paraburkholderia phytofirmans PsJN]